MASYGYNSCYELRAKLELAMHSYRYIASDIYIYIASENRIAIVS